MRSHPMGTELGPMAIGVIVELVMNKKHAQGTYGAPLVAFVRAAAACAGSWFGTILD